MKDEELVKVLADITKRLNVLEDFMFTKNVENSFKKVYDDYLLKFLNDQNIVNFIDRQTDDVYTTYVKARKERGYKDDTVAHIRSFNKAVRKRFPKLYIKHITRNHSNVYLWKSNE